MKWIRVRELVRKEFIQLFRDKKIRPILIIVPLVQLLIFGYVVSTDIQNITVGILDQSHTRESRMLIDGFNANRTFRVIHLAKDTKDLERALLKRGVDIIIKIPPDFNEHMRKGDTARVQIIADGSMSNMTAVRIAYASSVLEGLNKSLLKKLYKKDIHYGQVDARIRTWYNPNLYSHNYFVPGIIAFLIMILILLFTSISIVREREIGTMEQLIVTPVRPFEFIMGKTIPYIVISLAQMAIVTIFGIFGLISPLREVPCSFFCCMYFLYLPLALVFLYLLFLIHSSRQ